ncbi:MAG: amidohydrolase [Bacteroidota bacterium]
MFIIWTLSSCTPKEEVDLILHNGLIYSLDANNSKYEAMAVRNGKIIALGPEREILNGFKAKEYIDLEKKCVYPGFADAHMHIVGMAQMKFDVNLIGTKSFKEVLDALKNHTNQRQSGWLVGRGWDQNDWENPNESIFKQLNAEFPDSPVVLLRIDGHAAIVNEFAMKKIAFNLKKWQSENQVLMQGNEFTGIVLDNAMAEFQGRIPKLSPKEMSLGLILAQKECIAAGLTTIDEAGISLSDYRIIDSLQRAGEFELRVYAMLQDDESSWEYIRTHGPDTLSERLKLRAVKLMVDGALGSRGACLKSPYTDLIHTKGKILNSGDYYLYRMAEAFVNKWQVCTHAIGDSANKEVMKWYSSILVGKNNRRWRVEHAQVVDPLDFHYIQDLSLILSVQPTHAVSDGPWAFERLGTQRIKSAYAYKTLLKESGMLALGTDAPVEEVSVLRTIVASVFRTDIRNNNSPYAAEESLSMKETLYGLTVWPAISNFEEGVKGTLEVGKYADLTVLGLDLFSCTESQLRKAKVEMTVIGGLVFKDGEKK